MVAYLICHLAYIKARFIQYRNDPLMGFLDQVTNDAIIEVLHSDPFDAFSLILFLFLLQYQHYKELLQFLIAVVDAELLKAVQIKTEMRVNASKKALETLI